MNTRILINILILSALPLFFISCNKGEVERMDNTTSMNVEEAKAPICCEAGCRRGTCKAYGTTCSCTCIGGHPNCTSTAGDVGNVSATPEQIQSTLDLIIYLQNMTNPSGSIAAAYIENIYNLYIEHNGLLDEPETVDAYYENLNIFIDIYNNEFTPQEQEEIEDV